MSRRRRLFCFKAFASPASRCRSFNHSTGQSREDLQSPVPACHFWVDHKYRIVYVSWLEGLQLMAMPHAVAKGVPAIPGWHTHYKQVDALT